MFAVRSSQDEARHWMLLFVRLLVTPLGREFEKLSLLLDCCFIDFLFSCFVFCSMPKVQMAITRAKKRQIPVWDANIMRQLHGVHQMLLAVRQVTGMGWPGLPPSDSTAGQRVEWTGVELHVLLFLRPGAG